MNTRWLVLKILDGIEFEELFVHDALDQYTDGLELSRQERGFIKKVVFGTIENRLYLDYVINQYSQVKVHKMKPAIRHTMRLSTYQLLFMPNIPKSAVCNEAVKLVKKRKMMRLTGFVNGVLRSIIRGLDSLELPSKKEDFNQYLSVKYSFDLPVVALLVAELGPEGAEDFMAVSIEEAPLTVRVNQTKGHVADMQKALEAEGVTMAKAQWLEDAFYLTNMDRLDHSLAFKKGLFQVQDESSMLVGTIGAEGKPSTVLDLCSAPGGKTTHIADLVGSGCQVKAFDVSKKKIALIQENIERLGLSNVSVKVGDARVSNPELVDQGDLVIADVPCSGLGILRKKPDIKWHTTKKKIEDLVVLQREILDNAKSYVKPGGVLLYSTCTIMKAENAENVQWFLENNKDFERLPIEGPYAEDKTGFVNLKPKSEGYDGFFIAKMKRVI